MKWPLDITDKNHIIGSNGLVETAKKCLFGFSLNRLFFDFYCFRDLQNQTLVLTAICEFDK